MVDGRGGEGRDGPVKRTGHLTWLDSLKIPSAGTGQLQGRQELGRTFGTDGRGGRGRDGFGVVTAGEGGPVLCGRDG